MSMSAKRLWLSAAEVADLFGVSTRTVSRWIDERHLPGYRIPGPRGAHRVLKINLVQFVHARPEFSFVLELLSGQPITAGNDQAARHEAEEGGPAEPPEAGTDSED